MIDKEKDIIGFDIDVIEQIATLADINIKIIPVLKGNLLYGLIDETHDIAISSITHPKGTSRSDVPEIDYSKPYLEIGEVLVFSEDFSGFNSLDDLENKTVGVRKDAESKKVFQDHGNIRVKDYSQIEVAFEDMALGKIQAICIDLPTAVQLVSLNGEYRRIFKIYPEPVTFTEYVIAVKRGNNSLLNIINTGIEKMKKDDSLDMLIDKWFFSK
jgi:ABC-type amino acid transport substrate-binding protein